MLPALILRPDADIRSTSMPRVMARVRRSTVGEVIYNRGMLEAIFTAEAMRNAIKIHGTKDIRGEHVRDGLEAIDLKEEDFERWPEELHEADQGHLRRPRRSGLIAIQQWDAAVEASGTLFPIGSSQCATLCARSWRKLRHMPRKTTSRRAHAADGLIGRGIRTRAGHPAPRPFIRRNRK